MDLRGPRWASPRLAVVVPEQVSIGWLVPPTDLQVVTGLALPILQAVVEAVLPNRQRLVFPNLLVVAAVLVGPSLQMPDLLADSMLQHHPVAPVAANHYFRLTL